LPFYAATLPSHVSLKQTFACQDLERLDAFCERFAARLSPFAVALDRYYLFEKGTIGVLGMNVVETPRLRGLHEQLNAELPGVVADPYADYDGPDYRFHLTIEIARDIPGVEVLRRAYAALPPLPPDLGFTARELGIFYYPDEAFSPGSFVVYRVLPLGEG
jgi:2'-5' RNA ligase